MKNSLFEFVVRWIVGAVFVMASLHKITDPAQFAKIIYGYGLFPGFSINLIAIVLPYFEFILGIALIIGFWPRSASMLLSVLLISFIIAVSINMIRGYEFDCGCFTFNENSVSYPEYFKVVRNVILLSFCVFTACFNERRLLSVTNRAL
jgi:putative oxidoreductase